MDQVIIKGLRVRGRHGTTMQEMTFGQEFELDLVLDYDLKKPCETDNEEDTLDRRELVQLITRVVEGDHCDTAEYLAERITNKILEFNSGIQRVELTLQQPQAPILGDFDYLAIKIVRP